MPTATEARDAAIRDAKRYIHDVVRNDWTFEPGCALPYPRPPSPDPDREVIQWRLREYDSSGSELEPEPDPVPHPAYQSAIEEDEELETASQIASDRHRKRRRQLEEEMSWNNGLRTWMERRDAWAGARTRRSILGEDGKKKKKEKGERVRKGKGKGVAANAVADGKDENGTPGSDSSPVAAVSSSSSREGKEEVEAIATRTESNLSLADKEGAQQQHHAQPPPQDKECDNSTADAEEKRKESSETAITEPDDDPTSSRSPTEDDDDDNIDEEEDAESLDEPLIPIVPSLISKTNPIRASITESMYPSIYSKVVVQGLAPTVPINLADATQAMVQGWKSDGQWPPKPANTNIVLVDDATVPKQPADKNAGGSTETKRRRSSGVANAVRKVFHFSGHPFHRRGSSHGQNDAAAAAAAGHVEK